jgi:hypothetical protein
MRLRSVILAFLVSTGTAVAAPEGDSLFGTHWVQFQPVQVRGELRGCELVYLSVVADHAYLEGWQVAVNGSISVRSIGDRLALVLKVGLRSLGLDGPFERPAFAYMQTENWSTAKAVHQIADGEGGYKILMYSLLDNNALQVLSELVGSGHMMIGYNRTADGLDVLVPIDITVVDSLYTDDGKVVRQRSPSVAGGFADCVSDLVNVLAN